MRRGGGEIKFNKSNIFIFSLFFHKKTENIKLIELFKLIELDKLFELLCRPRPESLFLAGWAGTKFNNIFFDFLIMIIIIILI